MRKPNIGGPSGILTKQIARITSKKPKEKSTNRMNRRFRIVAATGLVLGVLGVAHATQTYLNNFKTTYPSATSIAACVLCHIDPNGGGTRNPYGEAFRSAGHSFSAIENLDSDGDGWTNIQEINANTFPGDATSHPSGTPPGGGTPDTTAPTVTAFAFASNPTNLTVSISSFAATDNVGVTGYLVTATATAPTANAAGWSATPPQSFTFASAGQQTAYAWAKDAAGNVSAGRSASTTITLPTGGDTSPPSITSFQIASTSSSLTVMINVLAAADNVGVTAFYLSQSSAAPSAAAAGWVASAPVTYTFSSAGSQVLYAWAKDAAGNISAPASSSTTITLPTGGGPDTTKPVVTSFQVPSVAGATTIGILSFAATDNVAVTGYLLTESSTAPSATASGWAPVPIWRYTFASAGTKTLYAWAKDAAGNVSTSASAKVNVTIPPINGVPKSINSTSRNRSTPPSSQVAEQALPTGTGYVVVAANDLGMHCGDLDQRVASILPPFNVMHAQVVQKGHVPKILDAAQVQVVYSAASNPQDPAQVNEIPMSVYKTNFWDANMRTGDPLAYDAFNAYYPAGLLSLAQLLPNMGLPVPDLQQFYLGSGALVTDQQAMPAIGSRYSSGNAPQPFALFYKSLPFFKNFPFGYVLSAINWFSAEGIPATPFDDMGRSNPYPLMRVQARAVSGSALGLTSGTVVASLDAVTPVSGEVSCSNCHSSPADGGSGMATDGEGFVVATAASDPKFGQVPKAVSIEWAFDTNILRLHDLRNGTHLEQSQPVSCQKCHYTPALDLAHVGPADTNGRTQTNHSSFSRVMHSYHGSLGVFPDMPPANGRSTAVRDDVLNKTCYQCHPGRSTLCFRGAMYNAGQACQDCHGNMSQVGNDFSQNAAAGGGFAVKGDFYTNSQTQRVPWANEPMCQSCHTGDVNTNLAGSTNVVKAADGLRLAQAFRTGDEMAKPIVAVNRRFAENQDASGSSTKQVLFRLSIGHGGIFCEGCHGSTHAEWPNAIANSNDNVTATQLQGHSGKIVECSVCHGANTFSVSDFRGNFDANGLMKGPHGMHPVDQGWISSHYSVYRDSRTPAGTCQACHGSKLQGSPLAKAAADRTFSIDDGRTRTITKGTLVSCSLCHDNPLSSSRIDD